ncbi:bacteriohemerythrin [Candidatus Neomarinimicrobiota bacterium]
MGVKMEDELPPIVTWDDDWNSGHPEIDKHHHKLVEMLQTLFGALITVQEKKYVKTVLMDLIEYTKYHFHREEEIFEEHGFDQLAQHRELHQDLIRQILDISGKIVEEGVTKGISDDLYHFLRHWLIDHIIHEDLKFKTFLEHKA